jgi:hypothetical protein
MGSDRFSDKFDDDENRPAFQLSEDLFAIIPERLVSEQQSAAADQPARLPTGDRTGSRTDADAPTESPASPTDRVELPQPDAQLVDSYGDEAAQMARHFANGNNNLTRGIGSATMRGILQRATESGPEALASLVKAINDAFKNNPATADFKLEVDYFVNQSGNSSNTTAGSKTQSSFRLIRTGREPEAHTANASQR